MRQLARLLPVVLVALAATGCIESMTLVKVKPDGSGTIEQTLSMKKEMADQLAGMMAGFGGDTDPKAKPAELFSEKDMREAAAKFGEGVTFVSSTPVTTPGRVGRVAHYRFADISTLHVDQKPGAPGAAGQMAQSSSPAEEIKFGMSKMPNGHSLLTIHFPEQKLDPAKAKEKAQAKDAKEQATEKKGPTPEQLEMAKKMFDGLKVSVAVDVAGSIVKTNSPYVEGNRVTLLEMDFTQLLSDSEKLRQVAEPKSLEEAKDVLKTIKGFKVNLDKELTVEFTGK